MSRIANTMLRRIAYAFTLGATLMASQGCGVGVEAGYPGGYYSDYPPDAYVATTEPVYVDGRAAYWYGGRWSYRDGGRWNHYERESPALRDRRVQGPPVRRTYESPRGGRPGNAGRGGGHR
jgi:hypothetical protein